MAKSTIPILLLLLLLLLVFLASHASAMIGRRVGGRTPVKNVEQNAEVQDLGRYCVQEYNCLMQQQKGKAGKLLVFSKVVEAQTQVVSGIKYYLTIAAARRGGGPAKTFEAVVVVKPWMNSKELFNFGPSTPPTYTK